MGNTLFGQPVPVPTRRFAQAGPPDGRACDPPQTFKINLSRKVRLGERILGHYLEAGADAGTTEPAAPATGS